MLQPLHRTWTTATRCARMRGAPACAWHVCTQRCADSWDGFSHAPRRDPTVSVDGLMAQRLACGRPDTRGALADRCRHCGRGTSRVAMRGPSSVCMRCATVAVANGVRQGSQRLHAGVLERPILLMVRHVRHVCQGRYPCGQASPLTRSGRSVARIASAGWCARTWPSTMPPPLPCWGLHAGETRSGRPMAHDHYQRGFVP